MNQQKHVLLASCYNGLKENQFNMQSVVRTTEGKYYFGGVNGLVFPAQHPLQKVKQIVNVFLTQGFFVQEGKMPENKKLITSAKVTQYILNVSHYSRGIDIVSFVDEKENRRTGKLIVQH